MNPEKAVIEILKFDSIDEGSIANFCSNNDVSLLSIACLLYTSPSPRDRTRSRMPSSA